jgi:tRNA-guanine family transglycosylase
MTPRRHLSTSAGHLAFPAYLPVTTFGGKFPLDEILRPYLPRFCPAIMVSHFYAQKMRAPAAPITFIDSGGFASLFDGAETVSLGDRHGILTRDGSLIDPAAVLAFQSSHARIGATLDFIITPDTPEEQALLKQQRTIQNAQWAIDHLQGDLRLYASLQAWDADSAVRITETLAQRRFAGFALGGMVPRISKPRSIFEIVSAIRRVDANRPLHVFGIGTPRLVKALFQHGVDSVDSSSFVRSAVSRRYLHPGSGDYVDVDTISSPADFCPCRVCQTFDTAYLSLEGELNTMALALHNLAATGTFLRLTPPSSYV